jgi:hypothetical protein
MAKTNTELAAELRRMADELDPPAKQPEPRKCDCTSRMGCAKCNPKQPEPQPRRMQAVDKCPVVHSIRCLHEEEHAEIQGCASHGCQPVEPPAEPVSTLAQAIVQAVRIHPSAGPLVDKMLREDRSHAKREAAFDRLHSTIASAKLLLENDDPKADVLDVLLMARGLAQECQVLGPEERHISREKLGLLADVFRKYDAGATASLAAALKEAGHTVEGFE